MTDQVMLALVTVKLVMVISSICLADWESAELSVTQKDK